MDKLLNQVFTDTVLQLRILCCVLVCIGFYMLFLELFDVPDKKTVKRLLYLKKQANTSPGFYSVLVDKVASLFVPLIKIEELKKIRLTNELNTLEIKLTPEKYYANAIAKGVIIGIFAIPGFIIHPIIGGIFLFLGVFIFLVAFNETDKIIKKRRTDIEAELPRFVAVAVQTLKNDRDIIKLIETYITDSQTPLAKELRIVVADMKTGNFEVALTRLTTRVDSVYLAEMVRGLISTIRGDDTVPYFETLNIKLWEYERSRVKRAAMKNPAKVKYLCMALMACMGLIYVIVFGTVLLNGMGGIMGQL